MIEILKSKKPGGIGEVQTNLTEHQESMQALRESEDKYRMLVEKSLDAVALVKGERLVFINKVFLEMFGYESDNEVIGSPITNYLAPQSRELVRTRGFAGERGEEVPARYEVKAQKKDGTLFDVELSVGLTAFKGEPVRQGVIRDITQRRKMEQALRESEEKFRLFQSSVFDVIYRYDPQNNRYDFISPSVEQQTGYTAEEFSSRPKEITYSITHPEDWERVQSEIKQEIAKGPPGRPFHVEYRVIRKDKREIWVSDQKTLEFSPEGKLCRINGVVRDITERKQAEKALRENEKKLRAQYRAIPVPTYTWQRVEENFVLIDYNDAAAVITQGKVANFIGKEASEMYQDMPRIREELSRCFAEKTTIKREMLYRFKSTGKNKHLAVSYAFVPPDLVMVHTEDITERKRTEEKLKEYTRQIQEKNLELKAKNRELTATRAQLIQEEKLRALGQMASGVAHNFNNLLAIVLGRAQLLQRKAKELEIEKGLRSIEKAALDASSTVKRIQDFARVRKDQEFKWVNIDEEIEDVIALTKTKWKDQAEANGLSITFELQKDRRKLPPVAGDVAELKEVFTNIIFNAVEAMPKGGKIIVDTRTDRESVFVSFADSGIGIPEEIKQRIFDPFFTTKGVTSAGLGLSVAYGIIQRHRGDIQIESKPGEGTTVIVRLPLSNVLEKEGPKEEESAKPPVPGESVKILIIEDAKDVRELLFDILSSANYLVKLAPGGAEGLEICNMEKFDIVFTDLGMPRMSGWEVAKAIKKIDSSTAVFLITGWGVEMEEDKLKESRIDRIMTKPIQIENLLTLVSEVMESKKKAKGKRGDSCAPDVKDE